MSKGTILFVEDEWAVRDVASNVLEKAGFEVLASGDGLEALEIYRDHGDRIVLVVLDVQIPGINGYELMREILREKSPPHILLTTGGEEPRWEIRSKKLDRVFFLQKPYGIDGLKQKVNEILAEQPVELQLER